MDTAPTRDEVENAECVLRAADAERSKTDLPREVWVCGHRYDIRPRDNILCFDCLGVCKLDVGVIEISVRASRTLQRETLWHEILHACDRALDVQIVAAVRRVRDDIGLKLNEPEVLALSHAQWVTMTDPRNADVMRWIIDG